MLEFKKNKKNNKKLKYIDYQKLGNFFFSSILEKHNFYTLIKKCCVSEIKFGASSRRLNF